MKNIFKIFLVCFFVFSFSLSLSQVVSSTTYEVLLQNEDISQIQDLKIGSEEYVISIGETINLGGVDWLKLTLNGLPGNYPGLSCDKDCGKFDEKANLIIDADGIKKSFFLEVGESHSEGGILFKFISRESENSGRFLIGIDENIKVDVVDFSPVSVSPQQTLMEMEEEKIVLTVGEEKKIAENISIKLTRLMEVEANQDCSRNFLRPCYNFIDLTMNGIIKSITLYKFNSYQIDNELTINLIEKINDNSGVFYITKNAPKILDLEIEKPITLKGIVYSIGIGESINISNNIQMRLLELPEGPNCLEQKSVCNNFAKVELRINNEARIISINQHSAYTDYSLGELLISFNGKKDEQIGIFNVYFEPIKPISSPIEVQLDSNVSEPLPYKIIEIKEEGTKDFVSVSPEKITMYNPEKETETSFYASDKEETINTIKIEVGEGETEKREIFIKPIEDKVILEIVKGSTSEDCEQYLSECKKGDEILCQKYEFNCQNLEKQTCENYLLSCKKGSEESCQKWDLNCKKAEITTETCGKLLSLCQSGILEGCKEYNNSCQQKEITTASTNEELKIQNEKIYINEKEVKVMPDTASEKAIETLSLRKEMEIELKDIGRPVYQIEGSQEVRVLGLFRANMNVSASVNGETGEIEDVKRPWWKFLVF